MIAVTFALPAESSAFIRRLKNIKRDGTTVRGKLKHRTPNTEHRTPNICVLHTRVGAANCADRVARFLREEKPQLLIASGFCGGTNDELQPGDLVIDENKSDAELSRKARAILPDAVVGQIHSTDRIIDPAADRYQIGREHGAIAIDMETDTIARFCAEKSTPMLALRAVSDSPIAPLPMPPRVLFDIEKQRTKFFLLFSYIVRKPASVIHLARFARQVMHTKSKLADALCAVIPAL
jgi:nucleoside phosphorylase